MLPFALLASFVWGIVVACFIQFVEIGRWVATRMTWLIASVGVGGDLLIMLLLLDKRDSLPWWQVVAVIGVSSVPVSARGIMEFFVYFQKIMADAKNPYSE